LKRHRRPQKPPSRARISRVGVWVVSNGNASADKVAIDTAAGSGMEAVCARELAGQGYAVALMSTSGKVTGSVTEEADLEALVGRTLDRYGRVDGVVNSTGHPPPTLRAGIWLLSTVSVARSGEV
jgi:NAD(P)-dependent dehydrogenase (short-subunit alcohol dehydrogenase family)